MDFSLYRNNDNDKNKTAFSNKKGFHLKKTRAYNLKIEASQTKCNFFTHTYTSMEDLNSNSIS